MKTIENESKKDKLLFRVRSRAEYITTKPEPKMTYVLSQKYLQAEFFNEEKPQTRMPNKVYNRLFEDEQRRKHLQSQMEAKRIDNQNEPAKYSFTPKVNHNGQKRSFQAFYKEQLSFKN